MSDEADEVTVTRLDLELVVRDCEAEDLPALEWTGSRAHLDAVLEALQRHWAGEVELVVVELPNGRLVGNGGVDYRKSADGDPDAFGELWMLSVHGDWQSLGVGSRAAAGPGPGSGSSTTTPVPRRSTADSATARAARSWRTGRRAVDAPT